MNLFRTLMFLGVTALAATIQADTAEIRVPEEEITRQNECCPPFLCEENCPLQPFVCNDSKLRLHRLIVDLLNACNIKTRSACFENATINRLAADQIQTNTLNANDICARRASVENLCMSGDLCVNGNVNHCTRYKAHLAITNNTTLYPLGTTINFDVIDDPNGNVILGPTRYIVPVNGYYIVTLGVGILGLTGPSVIAGTPSSRPEIIVNGLRTIKGFTEFMSFAAPFQNNTLSSVVHLNAGDVLEAQYRIFYIDSMTGVQPYPGQVTLEGISSQGLPNYETYMIIHYLSSDCPTDCPTFNCPTCTPVNVRPCEAQWDETNMNCHLCC